MGGNNKYNLREKIEEAKISELKNVSERHEKTLNMLEKNDQLRKENLLPMKQALEELKAEYEDGKDIIVKIHYKMSTIQLGKFNSISVFYSVQDGKFLVAPKGKFIENDYCEDDSSKLPFEEALEVIISKIGKYLAKRDYRPNS